VWAGTARRTARRRLKVLTQRFMILLRSLELLVAIQNTLHLMQMIKPDAADKELDARLGKLYPLVPGIQVLFYFYRN
jgi:hypothetical protein